jgi:hypothetical protein
MNMTRIAAIITHVVLRAMSVSPSPVLSLSIWAATSAEAIPGNIKSPIAATHAAARYARLI